MKKKGFTLVELVITIAIVIILSVISVPIYRGYVDKAKWSEGYALLGTILSAQKAYYSEYGNFLNCDYAGTGTTFTCNDEVMRIDARGNKYFTSFCIGWSSTTKTYFHAHVSIPQELIIDEKTQLVLNYNITEGTKFSNV